MGGGEELSNLVLLHPNCHRQLHSCEAGSLKRAYKGLSGVPGNRYAPFLGEGSPAMNCPYPTNIQNERNVLESAYNPL